MKKRMIAVISALGVAGVLAACGNKDTSDLVYVTDFKAGDFVTLGEYKGIEVDVAAPKVTDGDVEVYINQTLAGSGVEAEPVTGRPVAEGDTANIDYEGKLDGVAFDGGTAKGHDLLIGSDSFIPGFEDGVVGMEKGETKDIEMAFPDPYLNNPDLAGEDVVFTVTVNSISAPVLTDEFVAGLSLEGCTTAEEYREYVHEGLMEQAQADYENEKTNAAVEAAQENADFKEAPQGMVERMKKNLTDTVTSYAQMYGMEVAKYVAYAFGGTEEGYEDTLLEQADMMARRYVMLAAIADEEGITVTDEELGQMLEQAAAGSGYESVEEYKETVDEEAYREYQLVLRVMEFLGDNAVVQD